MESPGSWTQAEWVVQVALDKAHKGRDEGLIGLSMTRQVTDALREAGLLPTDLPALGVFSPPEPYRTQVLREHTLTPGGWECQGCSGAQGWDSCPELARVLTQAERTDLFTGVVTQESLLLP